MPAQALITHLDKAAVQKLISDAGAKELLSIQDTSDSPSDFLVVCAEENGRPKKGAGDALQKIANADGEVVRAEEKKRNDAAAAKAKTEAPTKPAAAKPTEP
jgi:hypothetical protein